MVLNVTSQVRELNLKTLNENFIQYWFFAKYKQKEWELKFSLQIKWVQVCYQVWTRIKKINTRKYIMQ